MEKKVEKKDVEKKTTEKKAKTVKKEPVEKKVSEKKTVEKNNIKKEPADKKVVDKKEIEKKTVGKNTIDKKYIVPKTAVKALINGFVSYGILLIFIFLSIIVFITWLVENNKEVVNYDILKYTLPMLSAFLIYFLVRSTCRLSTFDLFKNCKIKKDDIDSVCGRMNLFYMCLIVFSVITIIVYLLVRFSNEKILLANDITQYSLSTSYYAEEKQEELIEEYETNKINTLIQTVIIEMGLVLGIFSLIPNQRKLIERYN